MVREPVAYREYGAHRGAVPQVVGRLGGDGCEPFSSSAIALSALFTGSTVEGWTLRVRVTYSARPPAIPPAPGETKTMFDSKRAARAALVTLALAVALPAGAQTCRTTFDLATDMLADNELCGTPQWELLRS